MNFTGKSFTAQTWLGEMLVTQIEGLSIDAAREIARVTLGTHTGRIMAERRSAADEDYCEVYTKDGGSRVGTFAETTLVTIA